jgi:uncharacterized membrane protein
VERLLHPFGGAGEANATNFNGTVIVGRAHPLGGTYLPGGNFLAGATTYLYTAWDGRFEDLGPILTPRTDGFGLDYTSNPTAVSDDGQVVGGVNARSNPLPYLWTRATGMMLLSDYLTANGVTAHRVWKLTDFSYVSPDGKRLAGTGLSPQGPQSWIVTLP